MSQTEGIAAYLLPEYDEAVLTYTGLTFPDMPWAADHGAWANTFPRPVIIGGKRAGTWRRTIARQGVTLEANLFAALNAAESDALQAAVRRYSTFLEIPVTLRMI